MPHWIPHCSINANVFCLEAWACDNTHFDQAWTHKSWKFTISTVNQISSVPWEAQAFVALNSVWFGGGGGGGGGGIWIYMPLLLCLQKYKDSCWSAMAIGPGGRGWVRSCPRPNSTHDPHNKETLPLPTWSKEIQGYDRVWPSFPIEEFPRKLYVICYDHNAEDLDIPVVPRISYTSWSSSDSVTCNSAKLGKRSSWAVGRGLCKRDLQPNGPLPRRSALHGKRNKFSGKLGMSWFCLYLEAYNYTTNTTLQNHSTIISWIPLKSLIYSISQAWGMLRSHRQVVKCP